LHLLGLFIVLFTSDFIELDADLPAPFGDALGVLGDANLFQLKPMLLLPRIRQLLA
jgi:hypothetical protein